MLNIQAIFIVGADDLGFRILGREGATKCPMGLCTSILQPSSVDSNPLGPAGCGRAFMLFHVTIMLILKYSILHG